MKMNLTNHLGLMACAIIAIAFITLGLTYTFPANEDVLPPPQRTGVDFGRGPSCDGPRGLCSIDGSESSRSNTNYDSNAQFYIDTDGGLRMSISKDDISVSDAETQFVDGFFKQGEDLDLPDNIGIALRLSVPYTIAEGFYPATEDATTFIVNLSINQNR